MTMLILSIFINKNRFRKIVVEQTELFTAMRKEFEQIALQFSIQISNLILIVELKDLRKADFKDRNTQIVDIKLDIQKLFDKLQYFKDHIQSKRVEHQRIL